MPGVRGVFGGVFRSAIPKLLDRGYSASSAYTYMSKVTGALPRRKVFFKDWRKITGIAIKEKSYRFIPKKYFLPKTLVTESAEYQRRAFSYLLRIPSRDILTGKPIELYRTITSDIRRTQLQAEQDWREEATLKERKYEEEGYELGEAELIAEVIRTDIFKTGKY